MPRLKLHWQILIAIALAVVAGLAAGKQASIFGISYYAIFGFIGALFLNALKMVIVPLIASSIISSMAGIGGTSGFGRLGLKTLLYYMATSLLAILTGLVIVNLLQPGIIDGQPVKELFGLSSEQAKAALDKIGGRDAGTIADVFLGMFPTNIVAAAADNGQMLGIIVFSLLFGFFLTRIQEPYAEAQYNFWQGMYEIMMKITDLIIRFAPIGVFGLIARVMAGLDMSQLQQGASAIGLFFVSVILALSVHAFITMPLILRFVARVNPLRHYRAVAPALLTAFSTSSSSATLPLTLECVERNAGVSKKTASFVLPLGATVNMDGTALYECVAAMFIIQAYGIDISFSTQFLIVLVALMTSIGVAGVPAASLVAISIILATIGVPAEGIGLILIVDRILDMFRTSVNVFSDTCGAVTIGRLEGEHEILTDKTRDHASKSDN